MKQNKRCNQWRMSLAATLCAVVAVAGMTTVEAAAFPEREIILVVPYPPGGNSDNLARLFADGLKNKLNVPVVVENRPGGTTSLGTSYVGRSKPDGHTLLLASNTAFTVLPHIREVPYDPDNGFTFIGSVADYLPVLTVSNELAANNMAELVALAQAKPGDLSFGSPGVASSGHIAGELLKDARSLDMLHVPYKGSGELVPALLGGYVGFFVDGVGLEMIKSGKAKGLAAFSSQRHPELPDVPTIKEAGFDLMLPYEGFWGLAVPKATPAAVVEKLAAATEAVLADPDLQKRFHKISVAANWKDGEQYAEDLRASSAIYKELLVAVDASN